MISRKQKLIKKTNFTAVFTLELDFFIVKNIRDIFEIKIN
jgi:hypothetical protein